jgi:hypothetical protein
MRDGEWTQNGVMYGETQAYRMILSPACNISQVQIDASSILATGAVFSGVVSTPVVQN